MSACTCVTDLEDLLRAELEGAYVEPCELHGSAVPGAELVAGRQAARTSMALNSDELLAYVTRSLQAPPAAPAGLPAALYAPTPGDGTAPPPARLRGTHMDAIDLHALARTLARLDVEPPAELTRVRTALTTAVEATSADPVTTLADAFTSGAVQLDGFPAALLDAAVQLAAKQLAAKQLAAKQLAQTSAGFTLRLSTADELQAAVEALRQTTTRAAEPVAA